MSFTTSWPDPDPDEARIERWPWRYFVAQVNGRGQIVLYPVPRADRAIVARIAARHHLMVTVRSEQELVLTERTAARAPWLEGIVRRLGQRTPERSPS